jgi:predicted RNA binding protein YcfA (HicA-like mRNA interferase family)
MFTVRVCRRNHRAVTGMKFSEPVRMLEQNGFKLVREKGSIRYYGKPGVPRLIRVDYHAGKEVPTGTGNAILKAAGLKGAPR